MKKKLKWIVAGLTMITVALVALHISLIDGLDGMIWASLFQEDTEYAPGYTDRGWRALRIGMTQGEVTAIIGEPLQLWTNEDASVGMRWSRSPGDTDYRCRVLQFKDGRVTEKHSEYYVD